MKDQILWVNDCLGPKKNLGFCLRSTGSQVCQFREFDFHEPKGRQKKGLVKPFFASHHLLTWAVKLLAHWQLPKNVQELELPMLTSARRDCHAELEARREALKLPSPEKPQDILFRLGSVEIDGVVLSYDGFEKNTFSFSTHAMALETAAKFAAVILRDKLAQESRRHLFVPWLTWYEELNNAADVVYREPGGQPAAASARPVKVEKRLDPALAQRLHFALEYRKAIGKAPGGPIDSVLEAAVKVDVQQLEEQGVEAPANLISLEEWERRNAELKTTAEELTQKSAAVQQKEAEVTAALADIQQRKEAAAQEVRTLLSEKVAELERREAELARQKEQIDADRALMDKDLDAAADLQKQGQEALQEAERIRNESNAMVADMVRQSQTPASNGSATAPRRFWAKTQPAH